ncbi:MAG: hypothetical protein LBK52_01330 [Deltaproteobacteria bacterium]|jgi:hypothetical protein|nr:hypothetical protein [Deltaproteobacteria bacterium]
MNWLFSKKNPAPVIPGYTPPSAGDLQKLILADTYGRGQAVSPAWAGPLGAFTEDAVSPDDFDPGFGAAMAELLGPEE